MSDSQYGCRHFPKKGGTLWCAECYSTWVKMCETCGREGALGGTADRCTNCWEVERRLASYLESSGGREFVTIALQKESS